MIVLYTPPLKQEDVLVHHSTFLYLNTNMVTQLLSRTVVTSRAQCSKMGDSLVKKARVEVVLGCNSLVEGVLSEESYVRCASPVFGASRLFGGCIGGQRVQFIELYKGLSRSKKFWIFFLRSEKNSNCHLSVYSHLFPVFAQLLSSNRCHL